jgi:uncharacterized protein YggE
VEAVPDMLTLSLSAQATGKDVSELQSRVDATVRQVVESARENGVADEDIDSSRLSVRPEYRWRDGQRSYLGQTVQREIMLVLRRLDKYGALVQSLSRYDLQELRAPGLGHSKLEELEIRALEQALANGLAKARRVAAAIDAELGEVIQVEEQGAGGSPPTPRMMSAEAAVGGAPQIQFGKQRISATVTMRFAID